jgi:hypothetical protein
LVPDLFGLAQGSDVTWLFLKFSASDVTGCTSKFVLVVYAGMFNFFLAVTLYMENIDGYDFWTDEDGRKVPTGLWYELGIEESMASVISGVE